MIRPAAVLNIGWLSGGCPRSGFMAKKQADLAQTYRWNHGRGFVFYADRQAAHRRCAPILGSEPERVRRCKTAGSKPTAMCATARARIFPEMSGGQSARFVACTRKIATQMHGASHLGEPSIQSLAERLSACLECAGLIGGEDRFRNGGQLFLIHLPNSGTDFAGRLSLGRWCMIREQLIDKTVMVRSSAMDWALDGAASEYDRSVWGFRVARRWHRIHSDYLRCQCLCVKDAERNVESVPRCRRYSAAGSTLPDRCTAKYHARSIPLKLLLRSKHRLR